MLRNRSCRLWFVVLSFATWLGGCQGNLGSGSGISIPQAGQYTPAGAPGAPAGPQSRQQTLEGAVYVTADLQTMPLPAVGGFGVEIRLGTPEPSPSPTASANPTASARAASGARRNGAANGRSATLAGATARVPGQFAAGSPSPSGDSSAPNGGAPDGSAPSTSLTRVGSPPASPAGSASPGGSASSSASASAPAAASGAPQPNPSASGAKASTKTTIYPSDAPPAPTPQPSGAVQTFLHRIAIVRGVVRPTSDVPLYGLGAIRFTVPSAEAAAQRGFTVALFAVLKKHHEKVLAYDAQPVVADGVVASTSEAEPLVLKKGSEYLVLLYGDELPATPAPIPSGYPPPANNPFVTPTPAGPGVPGAGTPPPGQPYPPTYPSTYAPTNPPPR